MLLPRFAAVALAASAFFIRPTWAQSAPAASPASYHDYAALTRTVRELADGSSGMVTLENIATTVSERNVWCLRLAAPGGTPPEQRPAILIAGGIDADAPGSSEVALAVAQRLADSARTQPDGPEGALLKSHAVYVVPRANPDGIETFFEPLKRGSRLNARPLDDDRDLAMNEDGPNDLNGDGVITVMRVKDAAGEWTIDKDEPRLLKKADRLKGEKGEYRLYVEGIDDDGDGELNEDGTGGVDDDRNWPHLYESGAPGNGPHQLSEPETRGLAEFVLAHRNITAALVFGRNDNVANVQKGNAKGPTGQDFKELHPDDVKLYETISEKFKEITGVKTPPAGHVEGALYAWLYSQQGIPTFAINPWGPLDSLPAASQPASGPASGPAAAPEPGRPPTPPEGGPPMGGPGQRPRRGMRFGGGGRGGFFGGPPPGMSAGPIAPSPETDGLAAGVESSETLKKWLRYGETTPETPLFVAWTSVTHPTLGPAEVGGLRPYATLAPPPADIPAIAEKQIAFLHYVAGLLPANSPPTCGRSTCG
ncbi:MAG: hypothetical protein HZB38_18100 [Planctomycetes bacterium]|nr:hypothetical protein [Planctomycetota bacterium]